jgi:hypothetical protein
MLFYCGISTGFLYTGVLVSGMRKFDFCSALLGRRSPPEHDALSHMCEFMGCSQLVISLGSTELFSFQNTSPSYSLMYGLKKLDTEQTDSVPAAFYSQEFYLSE